MEKQIKTIMQRKCLTELQITTIESFKSSKSKKRISTRPVNPKNIQRSNDFIFEIRVVYLRFPHRTVEYWCEIWIFCSKQITTRDRRTVLIKTTETMHIHKNNLSQVSSPRKISIPREQSKDFITMTVIVENMKCEISSTNSWIQPSFSLLKFLLVLYFFTKFVR